MRKLIAGILFLIIGYLFVTLNNSSMDDYSITDERDGKVYPVVKVNNKYWMAANLAYKPQKGGGCYDGSGDNCSEYGMLYEWQAALNACPAGWRLPNDEDWTELELLYGMNETEAEKTGERGGHGQNMLSQQGGINLKSGGFKKGNGAYKGMGKDAFFWTSTEGAEGGGAYARGFVDGSEKVNRVLKEKSSGFSVRCVRD